MNTNQAFLELVSFEQYYGDDGTSPQLTTINGTALTALDPTLCTNTEQCRGFLFNTFTQNSENTNEYTITFNFEHPFGVEPLVNNSGPSPITFTFRFFDGELYSQTTEQIIRVQRVNDAPIVPNPYNALLYNISRDVENGVNL